tara:strand:- start:81 stop:398 length:318 start_codon:yes stop_codon:yes gene_type:complete
MKLTKAKLQDIISEEYQKLKEMEAPSQEAEVDSKSDLTQYVRRELPALIQNLSGIQGSEAGLVRELFDFIIAVVDGKTVNAQMAEKIKAKISQLTAFTAHSPAAE